MNTPRCPMCGDPLWLCEYAGYAYLSHPCMGKPDAVLQARAEAWLTEYSNVRDNRPQ